MKNLQLNIVFKETHHTLASNAHHERQVEVFLTNENECHLIERTIHSMEMVQNWFRTLVEKSLCDPAPAILNPHSFPTLSAAINHFFDNAPDDLEDSEWEKVLAYRRTHDIIFAFRGCKVQSCIIGMKDGRLTISWAGRKEIPEKLNGEEISSITILSGMETPELRPPAQ